jgi:two-component system sensor histidine kinase HydH
MKLRLTLRVAAPSVFISLVLLAFGALGGWYVLDLQKRTASLVALDMATMRSVQQLVLSITEIRTELAEFLATGDRARLEAIPAMCEQTDRWLHATEALADDKVEISLAKSIREGFGQFVAEFRGLPSKPSDANTRRAIERLNSDSSVEQMLTPAKELLAREEDLNHRSGDYNLGMAGHIAVTLGLLAICGAAAGLIAGVGIARSVTRSIVKLYVPVRAASGRLEEVIGPVDFTPSAGLENLDELLHRMADQVGTVVDRLQQSQLEVLRTEQMAALGHLAAGLAHELRNPLTALKIIVQNAIKGGTANGLTPRDLCVLETEIARLEQSIRVFLDFARPPSLEKWLGDVRVAIDRTLELVRARAEGQRVEILCELPAEPLTIAADHEQLRQLMLNLVCNALDALPTGGNIWITASGSKTAPPSISPLSPCGRGLAASSAKRAGREGERLRRDLSTATTSPDAAHCITITIADDGPGIPQSLGDRIFEPYVSTKETGIGLGLAISRRIVESHGGQLSAANAPCGGAQFTIRLPLPNELIDVATIAPASLKALPCPAC